MRGDKENPIVLLTGEYKKEDYNPETLVLVPCEFRMANNKPVGYPIEDIRLVEKQRPDGPSRWSIMVGGNCLNKEGEVEYEPSPSNRDEAFFARCRYDTQYEALQAMNKYWQAHKR